MNIESNLKIWSQSQVTRHFSPLSKRRTNGDTNLDIVWVDYPTIIIRPKDEVNINCCNSDQEQFVAIHLNLKL